MNKLTRKFLSELSWHTGSYLVPPTMASLVITDRCNFRCRSCSVWKKEIGQELDKKTWIKIAKDLLETLPAETAIEINGGEPLLYKEVVLNLIPQLKKHFRKVSLNTNGSTMDQSTISALEKAGLDIVKLSFYSLDKNTHNLLRGDDQAYDAARQAIEDVSKSSIALEIGILVTKQNIRALPDLIEWLEGKNISFILQALDESIESAESKKQDKNNVLPDLWPEEKDASDFFDWLANNYCGQQLKTPKSNLNAMRDYFLDPASSLRYRCFVGQKNLIVHADGTLSLCFKRAKIGNIVYEPLRTLLSKATEERKSIKHCRKYCRILGCNFSRGIPEWIRDF